MLFGALDPAMGGIIIAAISALVTYLVAARNLSGKIKNSDASQLWAESRSIREWSALRMKELNEHVDALEKRLADLEAKNEELAAENRRLVRQLYEERELMHELQQQNIKLSALLEHERAHVARLQWEAANAPRRRHSDPPTTPEAEGDFPDES